MIWRIAIGAGLVALGYLIGKEVGRQQAMLDADSDVAQAADADVEGDDRTET
jgi:hypothetical protein